MKKISTIAILFFLFCNIAKADFNDGVVAYLTGDYDKAFTTMQSLAETSNHGYAQHYLGMMYLRGQGVEQDEKSASEWFRKAAENSVPAAQYKLGDMYLKGKGVPKDFEFAYAWFSVGAAYKHGKSMRSVDKAKEKLNAEEFKEAAKLSEELVAKYGPADDVDLSQPIKIDNQ